MASAMAAPAAALRERILDLVRALRRASIPVAVSDELDALRAATAVDLADRSQFREALASTTVKAAAHRPTFDALFDVYFPARITAGAVAEQRDIDPFLADLVERVLDGDDAAIRRLALEAVEAFGQVRNRDGTTAYFAYRVFRAFNLAGLLRRIMAASGAQEGDPLAARWRGTSSSCGCGASERRSSPRSGAGRCRRGEPVRWPARRSVLFPRTSTSSASRTTSR